MYLSRIILSDFKNIEGADIELSSKINCICGNNGEGKTNLLDAIHYLSMTKSFLSSSDRYTFRHGTQESVVNGTFFKNGSIENIGISIKANGEKIVRKDSKTYKRVSDHIGRMPIVMVSPADTSIINDSAEERRRFINMMLSQTDQEYLRSSIAYNRVLKQRNQLLKQEYISDLLLDTMSEQMSSPAMYIFSKRKEAVESLSKCTAEFYSLISGGKESVSIEYVSELYDDMPLSLFDKSREKDKTLKYTTSGVHRDDLNFLMDGHPIRKCASQGQQKSFLISLKMAQYKIMNQMYGVTPMLLLDDVFDKLDHSRVSALINMVLKENFGQVFITDTDRSRVEGIVRTFTDEGKFFNVVSGVFTEEK